MSENLITISNISVKFGGLSALTDFSLNLKKGTVAAIIGPNGAGKTTVFNVLTGIYKPNQGKILIESNDITGVASTKIALAGIARTFQNIRLFSELSVLDNVLSGSYVHTKGNYFSHLFSFGKGKRIKSQALDEANKVLEFVGLASFKERKAVSLSYGDQRKLEIARALMMKPKLLLLDEPAAGMNPTEKENLKVLTHAISQMGITLLLIEHDMKFVMSLCSFVTVLDQGCVIAQGTPDYIQNHPQVIKAYLGE